MIAKSGIVFALALSAASAVSLAPTTCMAQQAGMTLERVVLVMRHGVRPPTKSAKAMASLSDQGWPDDQAWGAAPGELTPHGAQAITMLGGQLRSIYGDAGLLASVHPAATITETTLIWADSADQRTRETARRLALGLAPDAALTTQALPDDASDPLFDALGTGSCKLEPQQAEQAVRASGPVDTLETTAALQRLQAILAPQACSGGPGTCLAGASKLNAGEAEVKLSGPLATGATVSEALLLEYENGLPPSQVGWGRLEPGDLDLLLKIHEHAADLTRRTPYIALHRAAPLVHLVLAALAEKDLSSTVPAIDAGKRFIVLVGHDTNLSNLAGVFGLDWHLPGQPDVTAPGTAIAFEAWRNGASGALELHIRLFYEDAGQVRDLRDTTPHQISLVPKACQAGQGPCLLAHVAKTVGNILPQECIVYGTPAPAAVKKEKMQ